MTDIVGVERTKRERKNMYHKEDGSPLVSGSDSEMAELIEDIRKHGYDVGYRQRTVRGWHNYISYEPQTDADSDLEVHLHAWIACGLGDRVVVDPANVTA